MAAVFSLGERWAKQFLSEGEGGVYIRLVVARLMEGRGDVARLIGERRRSPYPGRYRRYQPGREKSLQCLPPEQFFFISGTCDQTPAPCTYTFAYKCAARLGHRQSDKFALSAPTYPSLLVIVAAMLFQTPEK